MLKKITILAGTVLILAGIFGFLPNPIIGTNDKSFFASNAIQSIFHILSGIALLWAARKSENILRRVLKIFGAFFVAISILGFVVKSAVLGIFMDKGANDWIYLIFGIALISLGVFKPDNSQSQSKPAKPIV